jgi:hypothetical protein
MKNKKQEMPRLFKLWMEITGEDLWNEGGPDSRKGGVPNTSKKD